MRLLDLNILDESARQFSDVESQDSTVPPADPCGSASENCACGSSCRQPDGLGGSTEKRRVLRVA